MLAARAELDDHRFFVRRHLLVHSLFTVLTPAYAHSSIITPYRLPNDPRTSLRIILSPLELATPWILYLTPGLLAVSFIHALCVTLLARTVRVALIGQPVPADILNDVAYWRWGLLILYQAIATGYLTPLEVIATRLSIQLNNGGLESTEEEGLPEGASYAGTDEDVIGLRPTADPYAGLLDCARKVVEEEGWQSLFRGWWWTMGNNIVGVFA